MSKGERVDRIANSLWSEEELIRRLPEIDAIYNEELRDATIHTFMYGCPDYFWERPSSSSGKYHSPDERGKYGNWLHTKRVFAAYCRVSRGSVELGEITPYEKEEGKAAALVHDMMKYGWPSDRNDHTVNNHDLIAADVARNIGEMPESVCRLIETHMGGWGEGPNPETDAEKLLQKADMFASDEYVDVGVFFPAEELLEEWPDLIVREVEEDEAV